MLGRSLIRRNNDPLVDFVDHFFDRGLFQSEGESGSRSWAPAVDLRQSDDDYTVVADLPGLKKSDIQLTVEDGTLTISGERKFETNGNTDNYNRVERSYGKFVRTFSLPPNVDAEKVKADFQDGVLTVTVPKLEKAKARQIEIR